MNARRSLPGASGVGVIFGISCSKFLQPVINAAFEDVNICHALAYQVSSRHRSQRICSLLMTT